MNLCRLLMTILTTATMLCAAEVTYAQKKEKKSGGISGTSTPQLHTVRITSGLYRPLYVVAPPGDMDRIFVLEQNDATIPEGKAGGTSLGSVRIVDISGETPTLLGTPFHTITVGDTFNEQGLLGMAFDPNYMSNGIFYLNYTDATGATKVDRLVDSNPNDNIFTGTSSNILTVAQPDWNHNGGWMDIGPDGLLYVAIGDGGGFCDDGEHAQDLSDPLGKILRVDPATGNGVNTNPFWDGNASSTASRIWAYGLRNPWRNSFDRETGDFYIADVGQYAWEEINFQPANVGGPKSKGYQGGVNYGWDCKEGTYCSNSSSGCSPSGCSCTTTPNLVDPIYEYPHVNPNRCSVTGGYVYRGANIPSLRGAYFFADHCSSQIWSFRYNGSSLTDFQDRTSELAPGGGLAISSITSFGEDAAGELYICDRNGEVFKIVREFPCPADITSTDPQFGDDVVNVNDLLALIGAWGQSGVPADLNGDGIVNVNDLLDLIGVWGPCQ